MTLSARGRNNLFALVLGALGYAIAYGLAYAGIISFDTMRIVMYTMNAIVGLELLGIYKTHNFKSTLMCVALVLIQLLLEYFVIRS